MNSPVHSLVLGLAFNVRVLGRIRRDWIAVAVLSVLHAALGADLRLRTVLYSPDEIYRLPARVGYQIDLEFEPGEIFRGLSAGDVQGLAFTAESNHLFIKPKAISVHTNLTVLTNRRIYHFDYVTLPQGADVDEVDILYGLRFLYPVTGLPAAVTVEGSARPSTAQALLAQPAAPDQRNADYWYCGARELQPTSAWDDGVQTHVQFNPRSELPAVFVSNEDGTEALINFNVLGDEVILHRIARRFILRRGKLIGCIVNRGYSGAGSALPSGTTSSRVERRTREIPDEIIP